MNAENQNTETERKNAAASSPNTLAQSQPKASRRRRYSVIAGVALVIIAGLAVGVIPRLRAQGKLVAATQEVTLRTVTVTNVTRLASNVQLALPGDVRAFEETKIYARADGYLLKWNSEIGAKVEAGQVLAEIDTPELDQELNQSRAALAQAQANIMLARSSAERWQGLIKDRAVSQQEVDEKTSALAAREADVKAAEAAVARLEKLSSFKEVRAPFAGTITRRHVDTGALIRAGGNASALFELAQTDTLRVQVNVPQAYLRDIAVGSPVAIAVAEKCRIVKANCSPAFTWMFSCHSRRLTRRSFCRARRSSSAARACRLRKSTKPTLSDCKRFKWAATSAKQWKSSPA